MAYTLKEFCADSHTMLKTHPLADALPQMAERLARLLNNPAFVAETFADDTPPGKRELYHDPELDFYVLAHVQGRSAQSACSPQRPGTSLASPLRSSCLAIPVAPTDDLMLYCDHDVPFASLQRHAMMCVARMHESCCPG